MAKKKILIVDDEELLCESLKEMLERGGCQVFTALRSEEAWRIFQSERPKACCIDLHMGPSSEFNGFELLRRIREVDKEAFCIVFTVDSEKSTEERAKALGADMYQRKPISSDTLHDFLDKLIEAA